MNRIGANKEIVQAFAHFGVDFLVVGGLAVSWYCSNRQADDMDLLVNPTQENSVKVSRSLSSLGAGVLSVFTDSSFSLLGVQAPLKKYYYADILTPSRSGPPFEDIAAGSVDGKLFGIPVRIPSRANLIRLKESAAVASEKELFKHRQDIALLKEEDAV